MTLKAKDMVKVTIRKPENILKILYETFFFDSVLQARY